MDKEKVSFRRGGEIGRRRGLKILRALARASSSLAPGTKENQGVTENCRNPFLFFYLTFGVQKVE